MITNLFENSAVLRGEENFIADSKKIQGLGRGCCAGWHGIKFVSE